MKQWAKKHKEVVGAILLFIVLISMITQFCSLSYGAAVKATTGSLSGFCIALWAVSFFVYWASLIILRAFWRYTKITIYTHNLAADIIENFENVLDRHNIKIPDEFRECDETESCLYGQTYSNLLDETEICLINAINPIEGNFELITDRFE